MARVLLVALFLLLVPSPAVPAQPESAVPCEGIVVEVATAEVAGAPAAAPDVYVAAQRDLEVEAGSIFKVFRSKMIATDAGGSAVRLYVGRLLVISVQDTVWIGRMIELAQRDAYPHVRYEAIMVGDCLLLESAPVLIDQEAQPVELEAQAGGNQPKEKDTSGSSAGVAPAAYNIILPKVLFRFDSARIEPQCHEQLNKIADFLLNRRSQKAFVEGHADAMGSEAYNLDLSRRRAQAVVDYLVNTRKLTPDLFEILCFGESRPEATNESPEGRRANRRVRLTVLGELAPEFEPGTQRAEEWAVAVDDEALQPEITELPIIPGK